MKGSGVSEQIAQPYAEALMSVAQSQNLVEPLANDVQFLLELLASSEDLRQFLSSPLVNGETKKAVLETVAGEQIHPFTRNFLRLLVDRRRIAFLAQVCQQFQVLLRKLNQTALAEVFTAVPLNDGQRDMIHAKALELTGARNVELEIKVDPELIGGVIIRVGSQVVDASIRGQLRRLATRLSSAPL